MIKKKVIKIIEDKEKDDEAETPKEVKPNKPSAPVIRKLYAPKYLAKSDGEDECFYYVANRPPGHRANLFEATLYLVSESFTACLVCMNELYAKNGFVASMFTNVILSCVMSYCSYSLTRSAHNAYGITQIPMMTYPDLAQASIDISTYPILRKYGGRYKYAVIAAIVLRLVAKCCVYQLIMARGIDQLFYGMCDISPGNMRKYLGSLIFPCVLICMMRTIDYTAPFSLATNGFIVILFIYAMGFGLFNPPKKFDTYKLFYDVTALFSFCGGCVFTMDTSCAILTLENIMKRPLKIYIVIIIAVLIVTTIVMCMGVIGGYGWGQNAKVPLTVNFRRMPYTAFFQIGLCLSAYNSFALDFWVLFNLVWINVKFRHPPEKHWIFERLYRAGFVLAITILGILFPDLSGIMSLFGALASGFLNFICPPIIEFLISTRRKGLGRFKWKVLRLIAITTFGWIFILGGAFCGLRDIFLKVYFV